MDGASRRQQLLKILSDSRNPVSGGELAKELQVSRQVIVQDIALLRAGNEEILSTNRGYLLQKNGEMIRIFKVHHTDEQIEEEMNSIVDLGGRHCGCICLSQDLWCDSCTMGIHSRRDVKEYLMTLENGSSTPLKHITSDYHYRLVAAAYAKKLDFKYDTLKEKGFLSRA